MRNATETAREAAYLQEQFDKVLPNSGIRIGTRNGADIITLPLSENTLRKLLVPLSRDWHAENLW